MAELLDHDPFSFQLPQGSFVRRGKRYQWSVPRGVLPSPFVQSSSGYASRICYRDFSEA